MILNIRSWNLNFLYERYKKPDEKARNNKLPAERDYWISVGKKVIQKEKENDYNSESIRFWMLQESSLVLYEDHFLHKEYYLYEENESILKDSGIRYLDNSHNGRIPFGYGLIIESENTKCNICNRNPAFLDKGECTKGALSLNYKLNNQEIITLINIHTQKKNIFGIDYSKEYFKTLDEYIIPFVKKIKNENNDHLIILGGDFNMNRNYWDSDSFKVYDGKKLFEIIENELGFYDCTKKLPEDKRSTMIDYDQQNDYIFINREIKYEIKIYPYEDEEFTDHKIVELKLEI